MKRLTGHCLCGAVTLDVAPAKEVLTACNCENCRRWTGGVNFTFEVEAETARIDGPVRTYSPENWAERAFCGACGSGISYRFTGDGPLNGLLKVSAGLFDDAGGRRLGTEFFADQRPAAFNLGQPHPTMTAAEVAAVLGPDLPEGKP
ncbi:MAG: GFA family protein [Rhodobacteraceae bacterium]|nr:GFA family protein [Paracoccaceae bacterium]